MSPEIRVVVGDITAVPADAIVNSGNTALHLGGKGTVARAILQKSGTALQEELNRTPRPVALGSVIATPSFGLPCRHILHVATHAPSSAERAMSEELGLPPDALRVRAIANGVRSAVEHADRLGAKSLALPLLGTGYLQFPRERAVEVIVNALQAALPKAQVLERVSIVVVDEQSRRTVQQALSDYDNMLGPLTHEPWSAPPERHVAPDVHADAAALRAEVLALRSENGLLKDALEKLRAAAAPDRSGLPMPAAVAASMVENTLDPMERVANLKKAFGLLIRYLGALALADYANAGAPSPELNRQLRDALRMSTGDGRWFRIARQIAEWQEAHQAQTFYAESAELWRKGTRFGPLSVAIDNLRILRNEESHELVPSSMGRAQEWLAGALPAWEDALAKAAPLLRYRLVSIEAVRDLLEHGAIEYAVRWLRGDSLFSPSERVAWSERLRVRRLYLTDADARRFLPLNPFLAYEPCNVTNAEETWNLETIGETVSFATFRFGHKQFLQVDLPPFLR